MGRDLALAEPGDVAIPVSIAPAGDGAPPSGGAEEASGLAQMLHQFLEQTLEDSARKRRQARKLRGEAIFRAAEDSAIRVRIRFGGDRIELSDAGETELGGTASVTADFLSIAHLTSGQESPFALLVRRKLHARFQPAEIPFLLRMLAFMRIERAGAGRRRLAWAVLAGVVLVGLTYALL